MSKSFLQNAEDRSIFLASSEADENYAKKGERTDTRPMRSARLIDINRIKPDPEQPRKTFNQSTLESLAESIKELGGIIDPLTVEYDESADAFRIISGERRYRAAKIVELDKLPCIIKEVNDRERYLMQIVANLQREDIPPLEEAAGIKHLVERYGYKQTQIAGLLNKSKSYVCQILGLERLSEQAKEKVQTSELPKEIQIQASREEDPEKQLEILNKASEQGKTVRQIRQEQNEFDQSKVENGSTSQDTEAKSEKPVLKNKKFREWRWKPDDVSFEIRIRFKREISENQKKESVMASLKRASDSIMISG